MTTSVTTTAHWGRKRGEPAVISVSLLLAAIEEEERRAHTQEDVNYSFYVPTAVKDALSLRLSYKSEGRTCTHSRRRHIMAAALH